MPTVRVNEVEGESDWRVYEAHDPLVGAHAQSSVNLPKTANKLKSPGMGVVQGVGPTKYGPCYIAQVA